MIQSVTNEELKEAMFSIGENKSLGPDGFMLEFFKHSWDIVAMDVTGAVQDFFKNGPLLTEIKHTILSLFPESSASG